MKNRLFRQILPILFLILSLALTLSACTGPAGPAGESGTPGEPGAAGTGIEQAEINDKGELILTYTDGTKVNLGVIRPEASENPEDQQHRLRRRQRQHPPGRVRQDHRGQERRCGLLPPQRLHRLRQGERCPLGGLRREGGSQDQEVFRRGAGRA